MIGKFVGRICMVLFQKFFRFVLRRDIIWRKKIKHFIACPEIVDQ